MKALIYYEGDSEREMLDHLLHKSCQQTLITKDYLDFLTTPDNIYILFLYDCDGYQNVFPNIAKTKYLYNNNESVLILRDLEQVPCFTQLKEDLYTVCPPLRNYSGALTLFSKPQFEQVYFSDLSLFENVFCIMFRSRNGTSIPNLAILKQRIRDLDHRYPMQSLKKLFKMYNMAFDKKELANEYFARFNFRSSRYPYIIRLMGALNGFL